MLLQRYYIDWRKNSVAFASIQGPRPIQFSINFDSRYSINPETFELTIESVLFSDRGLYLGVVGVVEEMGLKIEDNRTANQGLTLEVNGKNFGI